MSVVSEQLPEFRGHGEGDVLPLRIRENGFLFCYPLIREFFTAGGAKPALAAETHFFLMAALRATALEHGIATNGQSTTEHFDDVISNGRANTMFVFFVESPPGLVLQEQFFKSGWKANSALLPV